MESKMIENFIRLYTQEKIEILKQFPFDDVEKVVEEVWRAYEKGRVIYACGNGGNAAYVANFITDLANHPFVVEDKTKPLPANIKRIRAIDLTASSATITALTNDIGFQFIFSQQLINDGIKSEDLVFGFTGSGNSANIVEAFKVAKEYGAKTIAITRGTGGKVKALADHCLIIPGTSEFPGQTGGNDNNFHYEDALSAIAHMITGIIKYRIEETTHQCRQNLASDLQTANSLT